MKELSKTKMKKIERYEEYVGFGAERESEKYVLV